MSKADIEAALGADAEYIKLLKASRKACEARAKLPAGSTRARVTTANARWMRASEARDRREQEVIAALEKAGGAT